MITLNYPVICDHCHTIIEKGGKLCEDGAVLHDVCLMPYALKQLMPLNFTVQNEKGAA